TGPHQAVCVSQSEHAVSDAAAELTVLCVDVARVHLGQVSRERAEADHIGIGDGAAGTAKRHTDGQVLVAKALLRGVITHYRLSLASLVAGRAFLCVEGHCAVTL